MLSKKTADKWFVIYNARFFGGELPDVEIVMKRELRTPGKIIDGKRQKRERLWGATYVDADGEFVIELDPFIPAPFWRGVLLHEMAHCAVWPAKSHKSQLWKAELERLAGLKILEEVF